VTGLAALLRRLREGAGLTQEELAELAGVSSRTISDTERGIRRRIYADTANRLAMALGLDGPETGIFLEAARGRDTPETVAGAIPHPLTSMIGRLDELALLEAELRPGSGRRLVTITGLGGCGKSRLAIAAAEQLMLMYDGRVRMVSLTDVGQPERLLETVAAALATVADRIAVATSGRTTLLVLDAFEHVMPARDVLAGVLRESSDLHVLVTSRVRLRVPGEREIALGPLGPPDAARLFVERAADVGPHLAEQPKLVAEICGLVSGLPLPLELAAAHLRYLPLALLRDQLESGLSDVSRVVQDAVMWSMSSLSVDERLVLANAAVFAAGWRLDALQALCAGVDVVPILGQLADRCLIVLETPGPTPRWRMLDAVREATARIEPPNPTPRPAYTRFYLGLLSELAEHVGREQAWYQTLAAEEANIRVALGWAEQDGDAETLLALATGMWLFWQSRGRLDEGRRWLSRGLEMRPAASRAARMTALWGLAWLAYHQGDDDAADAAGRQLAQLAARSSDDLATRNALTITGMIAIARDQPEEAVAHLTEALKLARRLRQPWILATSLLNLGLGHLASDAPERARALLGEGLQLYEDIGDLRFRARCVGYLGLAALLDADTERATALFGQSLQAFCDLGEPAGIAEGLAGLAAAEAAGRPEAAAMSAGAASRVRETVAARELPLERRIATRYLDAAAEKLGPDAWHEAWQRGRDAPTDDLIKLTLGDESRPPPMTEDA
jgi:predicted ATPase/DNA-binding XRE family transcriptional regulator